MAKKTRCLYHIFFRVWQNFEITSFFETGNFHYPAEYMYNDSANDIEIILERKLTYRSLIMTPKKRSTQKTVMGRDKEALPSVPHSFF
jgi:hypothetical protein